MAAQLFVAPLHMGPLHPFEQALTLLLAVGPFVLLGLVVAVRRRADGPGEEESADPVQSGAAGAPDPDRESGAGSQRSGQTAR